MKFSIMSINIYDFLYLYKESLEEKMLKRNQRLLRHIVREVYLEETQLSRTSNNWVVLDKERPLTVENQRMYMLKKCSKDDHIGENNENSCIHSVRHNKKLSKETSGFEVLIESAGSKRYLGIGLTSENYENTFPGKSDNSVGYIVGYGEQPGVSHLIDEIDPFPYTGDMIGCRVLFDDETDDGYLVQLTRNRRLVGEVRAKPYNLFPFVAITHPDVKVLFRFVKDDQSTYNEKDDYSNQKEIKALSQEIEEMKKVCQQLQSQNEEIKEIKQMLQHVYRSMLPSDRKEWEIFV
ncbi:hypothetical protein AC249_AIPGENE3717 [Exaiptasia diaphana]|nr:hypothetical protein AC249_AIPGENE3717 [Exaiptasia diaphana]